jgi:hypothetical protein
MISDNWGCPRIAQQIALAFHIQIDKHVVRRILAPTFPYPIRFMERLIGTIRREYLDHMLF